MSTILCTFATDFWKFLAKSLPLTRNKEEKTWRKQEIRNAHALKRSKKLADKHYADGRVMFDISVLDEAYNLPDETPEQKKIRRKAMKKANKEQNLYAKTAAPYLAALRTVQLAYGYSNLAEIVSDYDNTVSTINSQRLESKAEAERLARERMLDIESKRAQRKIKKH